MREKHLSFKLKTRRRKNKTKQNKNSLPFTIAGRLGDQSLPAMKGLTYDSSVTASSFITAILITSCQRQHPLQRESVTIMTLIVKV